MYELFDHTADLGLRVRAPDLNGLFVEAARGLTSMIVSNPEAVRPDVEQEISVEGSDPSYLLFDWLNELVYRFDVDGLLFARFDVRLGDDGLTATAWGEPTDRERHRLEREVKAITYHGLKVEPDDNGWLAELIVDI